MTVIRNENVLLCDIDDTLVMHINRHNIPLKDYIMVDDPLNINNKIPMRANRPMIRCLEEELHRGAQAIVWSRGGYEWAANVLRALGLDKYKILVLSKAKSYFDDKDVSDWLKDRVYLGPDQVYKNVNKD